jgi:hypothetical protein
VQRRAQPDLGALSGPGPDGGGPAVPFHPVQDAVAHAEPVGRDPVELEAAPTVPHEDVDANAGELVVIVPEDLAVELDADIEYGGAIETPAGIVDGWSRSLQSRIDEGSASRTW